MGRRPAKQAGSGRRPNGTFAAGNSGNPAGRPRRPDFALLVAEHRGSTLTDSLLRVFDVLVKRAMRGDVHAAKLLLDRVCVHPSVQEDASDGQTFDDLLLAAMGRPINPGGPGAGEHATKGDKAR
ncbi:MAG: DUF5681 domain-containing protein [Planctomycetota bacterium]